jgi:hypothetical protein
MHHMPALKPRKFYLKLFLMQRIIKELFEVIMLSGSNMYRVFTPIIFFSRSRSISLLNHDNYDSRYNITLDVIIISLAMKWVPLIL